MASTNKTPHLGLCQWEATDPFLREDMNGDFARIDGAFGNLSRRKLFDITVTEAVPLIQLDFSEVDLEQFAGLEIFFDFKTESKNMRINGVNTACYDSYSINGGTSNLTKIYINSGIAQVSINTNLIRLQILGNTSVYKLKRTDFPKMETLEIYADTASHNLTNGDRISIWGVRR